MRRHIYRLIFALCLAITQGALSRYVSPLPQVQPHHQ
jgi:hypothetical protein